MQMHRRRQQRSGWGAFRGCAMADPWHSLSVGPDSPVTQQPPALVHMRFSQEEYNVRNSGREGTGGGVEGSHLRVEATGQWSTTGSPAAALASPGDSLEMNILGLPPRVIGVKSSNLCFNRLPGISAVCCS